MKKKISWIIGLVVILVGIGIITFSKKEVKENNIDKKENNLAIMVFNGSDYSKQDAVPIGSNFSLNEEKTYCEGGSKVKDYDSANGTIKHILNGNDQCYVYFDKKSTLSETVIAKISAEDYTSSQDGTPYRVIDQNGIRYEGANPDNYVTYNDEEWRIIGAFDGIDIGLNPNKKYTKIVRSNLFDKSYSWDCEDLNGDGDCKDLGEYISDWTEATLNKLLNINYLNNADSFSNTVSDRGLNSMSRSMIAHYNNNYSKWYLGGISGSFSSYSSNEYYNLERSSTGFNGTTDPTKLTTSSAIAIMYPSDYGYAMYGGVGETACINTTTKLFPGGYDNCEQYDWLYISGKSQWTLSNDLSMENPAINIDSTGNANDNYVYATYMVRPTLYLDIDVLVDGGNGSQLSPYTLYSEYKNEPDFYICSTEFAGTADCINNPIDETYGLNGGGGIAFGYYYTGNGQLQFIVNGNNTTIEDYLGDYTKIIRTSATNNTPFTLIVKSPETNDFIFRQWIIDGTINY